MSAWRSLAALGVWLGCAACQRAAPLEKSPHGAPQGSVRAADKPLDARRIKGASFGNSVLLAVEAGIVGDRVSALLEVPGGDCAVVIARGSASVEDLDLLAYGEDGTPFGSDEAPDREPSLLICPPHPGRIFVAARIAQGHGIVALGSERVAPALSEKAALRYAVKPRAAGSAARLKAWPGLDELVLRERARVGGKFQDLRRVALALDATVPTTLPATIEAGRCVHALFVPSDDVSHLDVAALDDQGRVLGRAVGSGRQRALVVCSTQPSEIAFEIRPHAGRGLAVAALSRSEPGSESAIEGDVIRRDIYPTLGLQQALAAHAERLKKLGYAARPAATKLELQVGRRTAASLTLGAGCTRIDVVGGTPLRGVDVRLWSETGQLRGSGSAGSSLTLVACGAGKLRLDASAQSTAGPVGITTQPEPDAPAELAKLPLAGSRLVTRMLSRGVLRRANAIGKVSEVALAAEQLTRLPFMVPLDRCLDIDAGIEGAAAGVELRVLDAATELELDSALAQDVASARVCAYGAQRRGLGSLNLRVEMRSVGGSARGLIATRLLSPAD
ncbi:MAG TPA: hypothetical protein VIW29_15090 [Polyangiaceae bacterium]